MARTRWPAATRGVDDAGADEARTTGDGPPARRAVIQRRLERPKHQLLLLGRDHRQRWGGRRGGRRAPPFRSSGPSAQRSKTGWR